MCNQMWYNTKLCCLALASPHLWPVAASRVVMNLIWCLWSYTHTRSQRVTQIHTETPVITFTTTSGVLGGVSWRKAKSWTLLVSELSLWSLGFMRCLYGWISVLNWTAHRMFGSRDVRPVETLTRHKTLNVHWSRLLAECFSFLLLLLLWYTHFLPFSYHMHLLPFLHRCVFV